MSPDRAWMLGGWLRKAASDLDSAKGLAAMPKPRRDTAIYHCQQAAEKAIKGLSVFPRH